MFWHQNSQQTGSIYSTKVSKLGSVEVVLFAILAIREALCGRTLTPNQARKYDLFIFSQLGWGRTLFICMVRVFSQTYLARVFKIVQNISVGSPKIPLDQALGRFWIKPIPSSQICTFQASSCPNNNLKLAENMQQFSNFEYALCTFQVLKLAVRVTYVYIHLYNMDVKIL